MMPPPYDPMFANAMPVDPFPMESPEVGIIKGLDPKKLIEDLRRSLSGYIWDYENKKWLKLEGSNPLMSKEGIIKFIPTMSSVLSSIITQSNYQIFEPERFTIAFFENIVPVISVGYKDFGIEKSNLPLIYSIIINVSLGAFKKGLGAGDRNVIRATHEEKGNLYPPYPQYPQQAPERRSIMSRLNPFSGN